MMLSSCFCFHPIRFSIHVLEWMLCRFFQSARLMPTSVLEEQVVLDRASVTGKISLSNLFIFNFNHAEAPQTSCPVSADLKRYLEPCCHIFLKPDLCMNATWLFAFNKSCDDNLPLGAVRHSNQPHFFHIGNTCLCVCLT